MGRGDGRKGGKQMRWDFPSPAERMKDPLRRVTGPEDFAPPPSRFKVWLPRPRICATLEQATAAAEEHRKRTGVFVCITEHRRRASWGI